MMPMVFVKIAMEKCAVFRCPRAGWGGTTGDAACARTRPELFKRWWVPKAAPITLLSCELDVQVGGRYRLVFGVNGSDQQAEFFGRYIDVVPNTRIVWTNEEGGEDGAISTVTFEEKDGQTRVVVHDLYPSKEALDEAITSGSTEGMPEQLEQLEELVVGERGV